ncbi:P-type conjugative transfer protein TrbL [Burkholderia vietnamiensis]|uniref:P-type conjugative transfer protein TrbL n=1 Tax=Burkholderia vietnamiensis TaxID=60552 RepID=UPI001B96564E|nr:P-type conjugative transfer protein TrbL [Burkholderia vietnamiensis]MBR8087062.1 P-type conjugative transfer protein TrbL [Burkholderia vietnamiensis]
MRLTLPRGLNGAATGVVAGLMLLLYSAAASAAPMDTNILDAVLAKYQAAATAWGSVMVNYASWLFWGLALISMVWTFGMMALRNAGIQEALAEIVRFFAVLGFFWWILSNGPAIADSIVKSMWMIGAKAIGQTTDFTPGGVVQIGFDIFFKVLDQSSVWSPVDSACGIIIATIILIVLVLVGVNLLLLFVSAWVLIYGGVFFLGFGGGRWTQDIAINYYKTVLSVGAQIMAMLLLIGIGKSFVDLYYGGMSAGANLKELGVMLAASVVLLVLTNKIPPLIGGIVGIGGAASGIGNFGAGAALGAAGMAAAAAATGGAMAMAGAANIAGGASALKAAFTQAQQHMAEGSGMFSGGGGGGGSSGGSGSGGSGSGGFGSGSTSGGSGGFMSAMSTAGRFAADMGANLAKGAGAVAKDKAANMMDAAAQRVGQTTGGKVASEISNPGSTAQARQDRQDIAQADSMREGLRAQEARDFIAEQSGGDTGNVQQPSPSSTASQSQGGGQESFAGDSLSAGKGGSQSASMNEEVAEFVNKGKKSA